ncbi:MAG: FHA domain-containing protein [Planctomycetes bacterium]|nr:FHA domain-containing protein [Planctomycetota bacterium]
MPSARELLQDDLIDDLFLRRHVHPALVIDPPGLAADGMRIDTPDQPFFTRDGAATLLPDLDEVGSSTDVLTAVHAPAATGLASAALRPDTQVEWLVKSARNPFGALITVGRTPNNDIVLPQATVSKVHAIFTHGQDGWVLSDSRSSNGTFLDGLRLPPGEKRAVDDGAEVRFGRDIRARFLLPQSVLLLLQEARRSRRRAGW